MGKAHDSHPEHELGLKNYQKSYTCDGCKEQGFGKRYRCEQCDFDLHKECMFPIMPTTTHDFFKNSTFKFFAQPPKKKCSDKYCNGCERFCDACGKGVKGFVYHCEENGWDLHPCCLSLKNKFYIDGVEFRLCEGVDSKCGRCDKKKIKDGYSKVRGWSYVSKSENCHFHVYCTANSIMADEWKNGTSRNDCLALENLELPIQARRNRGRGKKYWRIVKIFLKTIACILLGDPTITLACLLVDLVGI